MTGGYVRKHNHPSSLRVFSRLLNTNTLKEVESMDDAFDQISQSKIAMCVETCPMYSRGMCNSIGRKAPVGNECEAQSVSRNER